MNNTETEFNEVLNKISLCKTQLDNIKNKLVFAKSIHSDLVSKNHDNKLFLFSLEHLNFQLKGYVNESNNLTKMYLFVLNRIYCDYYKLLKLFLLPLNNTLTYKYNDLNIYEPYTIEQITDIFNAAYNSLLNKIEVYDKNNELINNFIVATQTGIDIINYVKTLEFDNNILKNQIDLYKHYFLYFNQIQNKYLIKLLSKINLLVVELNDELRFDTTTDQDQEIKTVKETLETKTVEETPVTLIVEETLETKTVEETPETQTIVENLETKTVEETLETKTVEETLETQTIVDNNTCVETTISTQPANKQKSTRGRKPKPSLLD